VPPARAGRLLAALGEEAVIVDVEGSRHWMRAGDVGDAEVAGEAADASVRLLPTFDHYVVGATRQAGHLMPGDFRAGVHRPQGWVSPVLLVNGRMDGVWRHERTGRRLVVRIEPFVALPRWARARAEDEAARLAAYLGGQLELVWES
jgi:hypothetical protein